MGRTVIQGLRSGVLRLGTPEDTSPGRPTECQASLLALVQFLIRIRLEQDFISLKLNALLLEGN